MGMMKPDQFRRSLEAGEYVPVYLLYGEDARGIDLALKSLEQAVLGQGGAVEFNADFFHGKEAEVQSVISAAQTLPMMAQRRLVVVRRVDEWKGQSRELLLGYLASPNPSTVLVLSAMGLAVRGSGARGEDKKLLETSAKAGQAINFARPRSSELPSLIGEMARQRGKTIEPAAAALLLDLAGDETLGLEHELDKVILYLGDRGRISREDVLEAVAEIKEANVFEFTDAIGERDVEAALRSFRRMLDQGQEPLMILGMLLRHFRLLWKIQEFKEEGETPGRIASRIGLNEWILKNTYLPQLQKFPPSDTGRITRTLAELDIKLKSVNAEREILFERTVIKLCLGRLT